MSESVTRASPLSEASAPGFIKGILPSHRHIGGVPPKAEKTLTWAGCYAEKWEILVYERRDVWEACFFYWPICHEHLVAGSLEEARLRAEKRIDWIIAHNYRKQIDGSSVQGNRREDRP